MPVFFFDNETRALISELEKDEAMIERQAAEIEETVQDCAERIKGYQDDLFKAHAEIERLAATIKAADTTIMLQASKIERLAADNAYHLQTIVRLTTQIVEKEAEIERQAAEIAELLRACELHEGGIASYRCGAAGFIGW